MTMKPYSKTLFVPEDATSIAIEDGYVTYVHSSGEHDVAYDHPMPQIHPGEWKPIEVTIREAGESEHSSWMKALNYALVDKSVITKKAEALIKHTADCNDPLLSKIIDELEDAIGTCGSECPDCVRRDTGWLPIADAPRDGRHIDVWSPRDGRIPDVYWDDDDWCSKYLAWHGRPTHFRYLPDAPRGEAADADD